MNLATTIQLYAGGPGSGCNPDKGKCGRPSKGGSVAREYNAATKGLKIPEDWQQFGQVKPKVGQGVLGLCHDNATECAVKTGLRVAAGVTILKKDLGRLGKADVSNHVWNVDEQGRIVDTTYGSEMASEYIYLGKILTKKLGSKAIDGWIWREREKATGRKMEEYEWEP